MMKILQCKTNLILVLIFAFVICIMVHTYISNGLVMKEPRRINEETILDSSSKLTNRNIKTIVIELFNESDQTNQDKMLEIVNPESGEFAIFNREWLALYLLTKMLSIYLLFAYIKGWLIKVSQITCNKARLDFLHLKSCVKNESSYKYPLTSYTSHSN